MVKTSREKTVARYRFCPSKVYFYKPPPEVIDILCRIIIITLLSVTVLVLDILNHHQILKSTNVHYIKNESEIIRNHIF